MTPVSVIPHRHSPVYRVVRAGWPDPLDASFSRRHGDNRWNPPDAFPVLYTTCSERVARAIALDRLRLAAVVLDDLQPAARPQLVEVDWDGARVVDVASTEGVQACGFPPTYPEGVDHTRTQPRAVEWHASTLEGVVCRSASLHRLGFATWNGPHEPWSELAIFVDNAARPPELLRRRPTFNWLAPLGS